MDESPAETKDKQSETNEGTKARRILLGLLLAGLVLCALLALVIYEPLSGLFAPAPATTTTLPPSVVPPTPTSIVRHGPLIVKAIQSEAKLQTYRMTMVNDAEIIRPSGIGNICTERIVYLGYYDVTAGVDLSAIAAQDVDVVEAGGQMTVTITLPPAELLDVTLDTGQSRLLVQETPKWVPGCDTQVADMTLEAQQRIKDYAAEAALQAGILPLAQEKAGFVLQRFLYSAGYPNVVIRYTNPLIVDPTSAP